MKILRWFLILAPVAVVVHHLGGASGLVFALTAGALIPLSGLLGLATDKLASHLGESVGGLLNATLGNLAEIIITVVALHAGEVALVKASIIGSVVGNLLFVLGMSFFIGGLRSGTFSFDSKLISPSLTALVIAIVAMLAPTVSHFTQLNPDIENKTMGIGVVLVIMYVLLILFRFTGLKEHAVSVAEVHETHGQAWSVTRALVVLTCCAVAIAYMSEILVHHVEAASKAYGLSELFVGLFVVPLIGNVAEHSVAVQAAWQKRFDLSIGIVLDSATQVALLVTPIAIFSALLFGVSFTLVLPPIALQAIAMSIGLTLIVTLDGEGNWWEGSALLLLYILFLALVY